MTDSIPTTLPVGLVRDLEAALARPGAGVIKILLPHGWAESAGRPARAETPANGGETAIVVVDYRRRALGPVHGDDRPPCPGCARPMIRVGETRLRCPDCGIARSVRDYRRLARLSPCPQQF